MNDKPQGEYQLAEQLIASARQLCLQLAFGTLASPAEGAVGCEGSEC